jgi:hypothetical protein
MPIRMSASAGNVITLSSNDRKTLVPVVAGHALLALAAGRVQIAPRYQSSGVDGVGPPRPSFFNLWCRETTGR